MKETDSRKKMIGSRTLAALLLFVIANLVVVAMLPRTTRQLTAAELKASPNEKRQEGRWIWWVARNYLVDHPDADIALLGSSQMSAALYSAEPLHLKKAVDCVTDKESVLLSDRLSEKLGVKPSTYMFAMGGAMASDHYMLARALFTREHKPKLVIVGVNPRDFIDNMVPSVNATEPFNFLLPYVDLGDMSRYAFPDAIAWLDWKLNETLPIALAGKTFKEALPAITETAADLVATKILKTDTRTCQAEACTNVADNGRVDVLNAIYGKESEVKPGVWVIPPESLKSFVNNQHEYEKRYKNPAPAIYQREKTFFKAFLTYCKNENIEVMVVGMPSLWPNRALLPDSFWSEFKSSLQAICTDTGATWVDLFGDERFNNRDYLDTVHMNMKGGEKLVSALVDHIAASRTLAGALTRPSDIAAGKSPARAKSWQ